MSDKGSKIVLVTGATGKVGQNFIRRFMADPRWSGAKYGPYVTIGC